MNVTHARSAFTLKGFDEEEGMMLDCDDSRTAEFRSRFEAQQRAAVLAALGFLRASSAVPIPDTGAITGPASPGWAGPLAEDPLGTVYFPVFNVFREEAAAAAAEEEEGVPAAGGRVGSDDDDAPRHVVAVPPRPAHVDPSPVTCADADDADSPPLCLDEYVAASRRHRDQAREALAAAALREAAGGPEHVPAAVAGSGHHGTRRMPGVPLYTKGQLAFHNALLSTALVSKMQHYYSRHDWKRAVITRLTSPTGATVELRGFATVRLGSFPCFRCQIVWLPSSWSGGDTLNERFNDDPHEPAELFKCGYGRVEMDIRPTPHIAELWALHVMLELPEAYPLELLWNVVVASALGGILHEHVRFINGQYRTTLRTAFASALTKKQQQQTAEAGGTV